MHPESSPVSWSQVISWYWVRQQTSMGFPRTLKYHKSLSCFLFKEELSKIFKALYSLRYSALQVGCQGHCQARYTKQYSVVQCRVRIFLKCVVCSIHTLCSLQPDSQPAKHKTCGEVWRKFWETVQAIWTGGMLPL